MATPILGIVLCSHIVTLSSRPRVSIYNISILTIQIPNEPRRSNQHRPRQIKERIRPQQNLH
jgi:hypothetical protein